MAQSPEILPDFVSRLTPQQKEVFHNILANAPDEVSFIRELEGHLDLLEVMQNMRHAADRGDSPDDLHAILQELNQPSRDQREMCRRIVLCCRALALLKREENAPLWAGLHWELAENLAQVPYGPKAENLEQAIDHFQIALTVYSREDYPADWARIQQNLATTYIERVHGEAIENFDQAISHAQQAHSVYKREVNPEEWAATLHTLAIAYLFRRRGGRAENLEHAITYAQQTLSVWTKTAFPDLWARNQGTLANAYRDRIRGERADNLERAMELQQQTLTVWTRKMFPDHWASVQNDLGNTYRNRIQGKRAENLERAIAHLKQSLTVWTRTGFPERWAMVQNNLANVYRIRIRGERAQNLEQAITLLEQTLSIWTRESFPDHWATAQSNLASAYRDRLIGERLKNLDQAIAHAQEALTVHTREAFPERWAEIQNSLANTYRDQSISERTGDLEKAIAHYQKALTIYTPQHFPAGFQRTQRFLAHLYFDECKWSSALMACQQAIDAGQQLLLSAYTEPGRQMEVAETATLYACSAYALLKVGRVGEALVQLEQGKTRLLSHALALDELNIKSLHGLQQETLLRLRETLRELENEMRLPADTPARRNDRELAAALNHARGELNNVIQRIRADHPDFMPEGLTLPGILSLIPPGAALVAPLVTSQGSAVFVVPAGQYSVSMDHVLLLDQFKDADLDALLKGPALEPDKEPQIGGWLGAYFNAEHNASTWCDTINATGQTLWEELMAPIAKRLATLQVSHVLFIPQGGLGVLPLHAAWHEVDGSRRYFLDDYTVTYLPSSYAHKVSIERTSNPQRQGRLFQAILDPTENLPFALAEGEQVARLFESDKITVLSGAAATADAVMNQSLAGYVHFACHGSYHWADPMQSGLELANHQPLTLAQIIGQFDLNNTRLVTLSACETGLTDIRQAPDEYLGLPTGFLQAGAPSVVSTLWAVNDLSTMLLMERFYQVHLREGRDFPAALRQAQIWLREVTAGELAQRFADEEDALLSTTRMSIQTASDYFTRFTKLKPKERPFAHPYYWAPFTFSGA